jgi:acetylornithine deacetylase/succinyl-diaminopimelate desuccinylase-like protein
MEVAGQSFGKGVDFEFLKDLIRIPSVTSDVAEVNRAVAFTRQYAESRGLHCEVETCADGRDALWVANVAGRRPDALLSAHLDVVPAQSPALFEPRVEGGKLFGRGASDCKEHVALALHLMERLAGQVSTGAIFATDEEAGGATTAEMLSRSYGAGKIALVLDSEQFAITTWHKGLASYSFEASAPPYHMGMLKGPPPNAVRDLVHAYEAVAAEIPESEDGSWRDTMTLVRVNGTREHAELVVTVLCARPGGFEAIESLLREKFGREPRCLRKGEAVILDETAPYLNDFLGRMQRKWPDRGCRFFHFNTSTDARHIQRLRLPMLIIGVDARGAHTPDEHLCMESPDEYADLIADFLVDFCRR